MNPTQLLKIVSSGYGTVAEKYALVIMMAGLVFALLNCFMGYKLRKIWGSILGLVIGAAAGGGAAYYFLKDIKYAAAAGIAGALVAGVLAWIFYKMGIFVLCTGLVYLLVSSFIQAPTATSRIICLVIGIFAATMALGYEEYVIIGITGLCGGMGAVNLLFALTGQDAGIGTWILGLILAFLGIAVQSAPLMRERAKAGKKSENRFTPFSGKKQKRGLSLFQRKRGRTKKKTVYKDARQKSAPSSGKTKPKQNGRDRAEEQRIRPDSSSEAEASTREIPDLDRKTSQSYGGKKTVPPVSGQVGVGIDLDDLSRELSQEIQKLYDEDKQ